MGIVGTVCARSYPFELEAICGLGARIQRTFSNPSSRAILLSTTAKFCYFAPGPFRGRD